MSSIESKQQNPNNQNQTNNNTHHPEKKKASSELSETVKPTLSEQIEPSEHSEPLHDDIVRSRK